MRSALSCQRKFPLTLPLLALLLLIAVAGCSHERETLPAESAAAPRDAAAIVVTAEPVTLRPVQRYVGLVGTLYGFEEMSLGSKVGGRVKRIGHDVSDRVEPGELLLEIDPTDFELNVRQAQKALQVEIAKLGLSEPPSPKTDLTTIPTVVQAQLRRDNAKTRLERAKTLVERKAAPEEELTEKMSEYRVAQAEYANQVLLAKAGIAAIQVKQEALAIAQQQLKDTHLRVPAPSQPLPGGQEKFTYAISSRTVSEGSYVMEGAEVFKLVIENPLKFRGRVPERKIGEVSLGQKAALFTSAYADPFLGEVTRINPSIDTKTRAFEVEILIPNPDGKLKPGGFAKVGILTELDQQAVTVPIEAVVTFAGVTKLFLIEGDKAKEVQVTLGTQDTKWVEIASPRLDAGAQVVTSGQTAIADGSTVAVRESAATKDTSLAAEAKREADDGVAPIARKEATP